METLANMGANMSAMLAGASPLTDTQSDNTEDAETKAPSVNEEEADGLPDAAEKTDAATPVEVNIDIEKTQGNAIYSSLLGLQNTLDNFQLDVKQDSLRKVVRDAVMQAVNNYLTEEEKKQKEQDEKLRAEGKPTNAFEAFERMTKQYTNALNTFSHNSNAIKNQYKGIADSLCELLGRINLHPYEKPKFRDDNGHILLNSLYLYPWYCFKCIYSSKHVRGFFKTIAWSVWLISLGLLFFIARDNAALHKQQNINRYVRAYFSDNAEVTMELEGIDLMFSNQEAMPMPIKEYREYMKERKKEVKGSKRK